jgi:hypothetical protein
MFALSSCGREVTLDVGLEDEDTLAASGWHPSPRWAWVIALMASGVGVLAWAGSYLAASELRTRGCDAQVLVATALLAWDPSSLAWTLPVPGLLLAEAERASPTSPRAASVASATRSATDIRGWQAR